MMPATASELFAVRFADCMARLKALGLKGEVTVTAGVVMVATTDKWSAQHFRKAIKTAADKAGAVRVENRPAPGAWVFTVVCAP